MIATCALLTVLLVLGWTRLRRCRHRFGLPVHGAIRCMRCARRFPIYETAGSWRIGSKPMPE